MAVLYGSISQLFLVGEVPVGRGVRNIASSAALQLVIGFYQLKDSVLTHALLCTHVELSYDVSCRKDGFGCGLYRCIASLSLLMEKCACHNEVFDETLALPVRTESEVWQSEVSAEVSEG